MNAELISPERATQLVIFAAIVLSLLGAALGFRAAKTRGLIAILAGPLVGGMWVFHQWITRYDPNSGYFGLDKVWVLAVEGVIFIALGGLCGWIWNRVIAPR